MLQDLQATMSFIRNPEQFVVDQTAKHGPTWVFPLAGRRMLVTSDSALVREFFENRSDALFYAEPIADVFGTTSVLFQVDETHQQLRTLLRVAMHDVPMHAIADEEAATMCDVVLMPLFGSFRIDLMPGIRRYLFLAALRMLAGNYLKTSLGLVRAWEIFMKSLHPLLLMPPFRWVRFSCGGLSPWDRCCKARDKVRSILAETIQIAEKNSPAARMRRDIGVSMLVDQMMTLLFGSVDNAAITIAWALQEMKQNPFASTSQLMTTAITQHPPLPIIPHGLRQACPEYGLREGDGVAIAPAFLEGASFGWGVHQCLGVAWSKALVFSMLRTLRPFLAKSHLKLGPSCRQNFSWGPSEIWLSSNPWT